MSPRATRACSPSWRRIAMSEPTRQATTCDQVGKDILQADECVRYRDGNSWHRTFRKFNTYGSMTACFFSASHPCQLLLVLTRLSRLLVPFDNALRDNGLDSTTRRASTNVPMYRTQVPLCPQASFRATPLYRWAIPPRRHRARPGHHAAIRSHAWRTYRLGQSHRICRASETETDNYREPTPRTPWYP